MLLHMAGGDPSPVQERLQALSSGRWVASGYHSVGNPALAKAVWALQPHAGSPGRPRPALSGPSAVGP